ncbi:hypothetical protein Taro_046753 [Colocasia esculenta]|uniref:Uncharacterized protein n=1 Tax=Colocasia esculenta TaxID=4460 RepID=A0A843WUJ2_COLES|nr:hypothetical protein [Colocasia esculenta]
MAVTPPNILSSMPQLDWLQPAPPCPDHAIEACEAKRVERDDDKDEDPRTGYSYQTDKYSSIVIYLDSSNNYVLNGSRLHFVRVRRVLQEYGSDGGERRIEELREYRKK